MFNYFGKLIARIVRKHTRKIVDLEREIFVIIVGIGYPLTKEDIIAGIYTNYYGVFSKFEIEYTIDRMVCDKKILAYSDGYIDPKSNKKIPAKNRVVHLID